MQMFSLLVSFVPGGGRSYQEDTSSQVCSSLDTQKQGCLFTCALVFFQCLHVSITLMIKDSRRIDCFHLGHAAAAIEEGQKEVSRAK